MGFPVGYTELLLPKLFLQILSLLSFLRKLISALFHYLGLQHFLEPDTINHHPLHPQFQSVSALLIREILPVVTFQEVADPAEESCAVCLYEFQGDDEIRRLRNCRHIFHRRCLDRWMGYEQRTCPLCRTPLIPYDMQACFNQSLWDASAIPEFS
ncbi:brassinosteroid-responsive RING protein 1-like [Arachis stenosperma]|uniref:brassinosteroid-responsive RING protein 1-like n=1 Tax=Arachis stenosperma TaxID=217475 RepID=UPI0025AD8C2E|nr:brassinosteroid-responsive RING protein 1-like [Arachis stenosperma]